MELVTKSLWIRPCCITTHIVHLLDKLDPQLGQQQLYYLWWWQILYGCVKQSV